MKDKFTNYIHDLQNSICDALEKVDGKAVFREDRWEREGGGGGKSRIIENGNVFEKGGVNTSVVHGCLPDSMKAKFGVKEGNFFACGVSLVLHPENPKVPTVHANFRYFELYNEKGEKQDAWFGGGADLTPYSFYKDDAKHFHNVLKQACDKHASTFYPDYKKACDNYFYNSHRQEPRGAGGLFFDYLRKDDKQSLESWYDFVTEIGDIFVESYVPIAEKRKNESYTDQNRYWQELRRGRYVEFNLIHDRGTIFGLKTNGRIQSILMSLPPRVRWDYDETVKIGDSEQELLDNLQMINRGELVLVN